MGWGAIICGYKGYGKGGQTTPFDRLNRPGGKSEGRRRKQARRFAQSLWKSGTMDERLETVG